MRLALNIPSYRLELYRGESLVRAYRVAVGDSSFPTPVGQFAISRVEWDPSWNPPPSEWAKGDTVIPPGPENPMGRVKMAFHELYFVHGTPRGQSLGQPASHGCVRLANREAVELADLVQRYGSPELSGERIDSIAAQAGSGITQRFDLQRPVLLQVRYEVVELHPDTILLYPDIYAMEGTPVRAQVLSALARAGYDTAALDSTRVSALELPTTGRRVIPLGILRRSTTGTPLSAPRR
jgi:murein L,D-transpeptidase YcbB/YkuD